MAGSNSTQSQYATHDSTDSSGSGSYTLSLYGYANTTVTGTLIKTSHTGASDTQNIVTATQLNGSTVTTGSRRATSDSATGLTYSGTGVSSGSTPSDGNTADTYDGDYTESGEHTTSIANSADWGVNAAGVWTLATKVQHDEAHDADRWSFTGDNDFVVIGGRGQQGDLETLQADTLHGTSSDDYVRDLTYTTQADGTRVVSGTGHGGDTAVGVDDTTIDRYQLSHAVYHDQYQYADGWTESYAGDGHYNDPGLYSSSDSRWSTNAVNGSIDIDHTYSPTDVESEHGTYDSTDSSPPGYSGYARRYTDRLDSDNVLQTHLGTFYNAFHAQIEQQTPGYQGPPEHPEVPAKPTVTPPTPSDGPPVPPDAGAQHITDLEARRAYAASQGGDTAWFDQQIHEAKQQFLQRDVPVTPSVVAETIQNASDSVNGTITEVVNRGLDFENDLIYLESDGLLGSSNQNLSNESRLQASGRATATNLTIAALPFVNNTYGTFWKKDFATGEQLSADSHTSAIWGLVSDVAFLASAGVKYFDADVHLINCFIAGTDVLAGDGSTEEQIQDVHVGQRVATDGGVATSADGSAAADPNATQVDPATWRLVTITSGDWHIQTLQSEAWIEAHHLTAGDSIQLSDIVDLQEMGVPDGLTGTVDSISACPPIESGTGRLVLTTVNHLNDNVYDLTLTDANGQADTLGVTGYHRIYTEDRGWVDADDLTQGELVRGHHGDLTVTSVARDPGIFRVYNFTVEGDHDYYVGDLSALAHNTCAPNNGVEVIKGSLLIPRK